MQNITSEDKIGENIQNLGLGEEFLDMKPKARFIKGKLDKLDFIKIKNFCSVKDPVKTMKTQATD